MHRFILPIAASLAACAAACSPSSMAEEAVAEPRAVTGADPTRHVGFHRGIAYSHSFGRRGRGQGYGSEVSARTIEQLAERGVDWISLTPFGYPGGFESTSIRNTFESRGGESDPAMAGDVAAARAAGVKVMMKPHLWMHQGWIGDITFTDEADWDAWFANYTAWIVHYAEFSQERGVDYLVVGTELKGTSMAQPERWRAVIAAVREVYEGPLTYAANWDEYQQIEFWDDLDSIGVNAYFPLASTDRPTLDQLTAAAEAVARRIETVQRRFDRPVVLTEIGYRSVEGAPVKPWEFRERGETDLEIQAQCYEAIYRAFWDEPWLGGIYWWKWFSGASAAGPETFDRDPFSPRGKPAEDVMFGWYQKERDVGGGVDR